VGFRAPVILPPLCQTFTWKLIRRQAAPRGFQLLTHGPRPNQLFCDERPACPVPQACDLARQSSGKFGLVKPS